MTKLLSLVSLSSIMTGAHDMRRRNAKLGRQLAANATRKWDQSAQTFLAQWSPLSMADALRQSWAHARRQAEQIKVDRSATPEADRLHAIAHDILILENRDRWTQAHYADMARLQGDHNKAWQAARAAVQS